MVGSRAGEGVARLLTESTRINDTHDDFESSFRAVGAPVVHKCIFLCAQLLELRRTQRSSFFRPWLSFLPHACGGRWFFQRANVHPAPCMVDE